jgi:integral membrane protein
MPNLNRPYLRWLIIVGLLEGFSTLALFFIAMPMKYWYDIPMAVKIVGPVHGVLFLALAIMFLMGRTAVPLSTKMMWVGLIGSVVPLMPFFVDIPLYRMLQAANCQSDAACGETGKCSSPSS